MKEKRHIHLFSCFSFAFGAETVTTGAHWYHHRRFDIIIPPRSESHSSYRVTSGREEWTRNRAESQGLCRERINHARRDEKDDDDDDDDDGVFLPRLCRLQPGPRGMPGMIKTFLHWWESLSRFCANIVFPQAGKSLVFAHKKAASAKTMVKISDAQDISLDAS